MSHPDPLNIPELERPLWNMYREFFDKAERKRRWNIREDIPWDQCNPNLNPAIGDVVETFTAIELYLPDYTSKILPVVRSSKGRVWFYANWGYEESKHSLALGDWLLKSGTRTEEQMADVERRVFEREWNLPQDSQLGMMVYAMVQEQATFINYRNLKHRTKEMGGDPALEQLLQFVSIDEAAHHGFFADALKLYLDYDREMVIEQMRRVMNYFQMPVIHDILDESKSRIQGVKDLAIFDESIYYKEVYMPILEHFGIGRNEMRDAPRAKKSLKV